MSADNLSKAIKEGICDALGRKSRFQLIKVFDLEVKSQKTEARVVVLTEYKMHIIVPKLPVKVEHSIHFLNIQSMNSPSYDKVTIGTDLKSLNLRQLGDDLSDTQQLIYCIADTLVMVFPSLLQVLMERISLTPASQMQELAERLQDLQSRVCSPCGRFTYAYHCMCDYYGLPFLEEIAWDIDTIYMSHSSRYLCLNDFDHLDNRCLTPLLSALMYNDWFKKLNISNIKLTAENTSAIVRVFETNVTLQEIMLVNMGLKCDSIQRFATSFLLNTQIALSSLDISGNLIEDKGLSYLLPVIDQMSDSLTSLNLSKTGVTSKGTNRLASLFNKNRQFIDRLKLFDLSENVLRTDDLTYLYSYLSKPNSLTCLNLANTDCSLDLVIGCLATGCTQHLAQLNFSHNVYSSSSSGSKKSAKVSLLSWQQFFSSSGALRSVSVAGTRLPAEVLKSILLGLSQKDCQVLSLDLNLRSNAFGSAGADVLQSFIPNISCITTLDISDNALDNSLAKVLLSIAKNKHIRKLSVGKNLSGAKPKHVLQSVRALVQIVTDDSLSLESLSIEDLRLKRDMTLLLNALCGNVLLTELNISGNQMGDYGARILSKVLLINRRLTHLHCDRNNISVIGLLDIATALQRNHSLTVMPVPVNDVVNLMRVCPEKTEHVLQQIQLLLHRNSGPQKSHLDQSFKLRHLFLVNSTQQVIDQLIIRLQSVIGQLEAKCLSEETQEEISQALGLIKDASVSRHLLLELETLSKAMQDRDAEVPSKLSSIAVDLQATIVKQFKALAADMFKYLEVHCPAVCNSKIVDAARAMSLDLSNIPSDFVHNLIKDHLEVEVFSRLDELNFVLAGFLCKKLMEEVILSLDKVLKSLKHTLKCESQPANVAHMAALRHRSAHSTLDSRSLSSSVSDDSASEGQSLVQKALRTRHLRPSSHLGPLPGESCVSGGRVEDGSSSSTSPFKTHSTPALLGLSNHSGDAGCESADSRPPVAVFRKRKGFTQTTSASFEIIIDDRPSSCERANDDAIFVSPTGDIFRSRKERGSWRAPEIPGKRLEPGYVMRRSSDTFLYQSASTAGSGHSSFLSPGEDASERPPPSLRPASAEGDTEDEMAVRPRKSFESNQLSLLSAMLATSAASIAMITIQKGSSSSSSLNHSEDQDLSKASTTDQIRTNEGGDYGGADSQTTASITDSDVVTEEDPIRLSSDLVHPTKDRPKPPKTHSSSRRSVFTCKAFLASGHEVDQDRNLLNLPPVTLQRHEDDRGGATGSTPLQSQRAYQPLVTLQSVVKAVCVEVGDFNWDQGGTETISGSEKLSSIPVKEISKARVFSPPSSSPPPPSEIPVESEESSDSEKAEGGRKSHLLPFLRSRLPPIPAPKPSKKTCPKECSTERE